MYDLRDTVERGRILKHEILLSNIRHPMHKGRGEGVGDRINTHFEFSNLLDFTRSNSNQSRRDTKAISINSATIH